MLRIAATVLVFLAWHFPTTFFVPSGPPNERGWSRGHSVSRRDRSSTRSVA